MIKAVERIVKSSNIYQRKKFSKFLTAITDSNQPHVAELLAKAFNDAGLNSLVTGQIPKVRICSLYRLFLFSTQNW